MKRFWIITSVILICMKVQAAILHVPSGQYSSIQAAIDDAQNNDTIIVDPNTYYENINFRGKDITLTSTDPNDPEVVATTIINGSNPQDPNFASVVTFNSAETNKAILTGFTITAGTGTWLVIAWDLHEPYWNRCGGGVVCYNMAQPTITKNVFSNNTAGEGGAIYVYGDPVNPANPTDPPVHITPIINNNTFVNNSAVTSHGFEPPNIDYPNGTHGDGGAIVCFQGCDVTISGNIINDNHADWYGGGIHLRQWSNGLIEENQIIGNDSRLGAGVHLTYNSNPTVRKNNIKANISGKMNSDLGGGGIYIYYHSNPIIEQNLITQNSSNSGAGIAVLLESDPLIRNNVIIDNLNSAGIRVISGSIPIITNNTIVGNTASQFYAGGVDCITDSVVIIENNIIASNGNSYGIYASSVAPAIKYNNVWGNASGNYNSIIGDQAGINGNISIEPDFKETGDYHLKLSSPCINAGDPNIVPGVISDYDGDPRKLGQYIDIGADEVWPIQNINSNGQYESIQQAVNEADDYDVIVLTRGIYTGDGNHDIDFADKSVTVQSINPDDFDIVSDTVIDAQGTTQASRRVFYFHSGEDANSIVNGLTITGGYGAYEGGGIKCTSASSPTIVNCIVRNNRARDHGGGIFCGDASNPVIKNCFITENSFSPYGYGAGIYCSNSSPIITNCIITNNVVLGNSEPDSGRHGGGICCWGNQNGHSDPIVTNCIIAGNSAEHRGGGLYAYWSSPTFINCTVIGNKAYRGGGVATFGRDIIPEAIGNLTLINCIVRDNKAVFGDQLAVVSPIRVWGWVEVTKMTVSYSNIEGEQPEVWVDPDMILNWGDGNIDIDPNFVDTGQWDNSDTPTDPNDDIFNVGNYHLLPVSGCIDAGDNSLIPVESTMDIDQEQRIFNDTVDIGADEVVTNLADFNSDGTVDLVDLFVVITEWLNTGSNLQTDLFDDDSINFTDYAIFAQQWYWIAGWHEQ